MVVSSTAHWAKAQTTADPAAGIIEEGLRRQNERQREQLKGLQQRSDVLTAAPSTARIPELPIEHPCFAIREIALLGDESLRFRWLLSTADSFIGRCIGTAGIARIAAYLDAQLIEQGYVTSRVALGQQNLSDGRLAFQLHVGRIASVRMTRGDAKDSINEGDSDTRWGTWINAFPTTSGRLLNARDIEQGVEQMKRLPSQNVATKLTPGGDVDTSILTIERQTGELKDRVRGGVTLDNSGSPTLGRTQFSANLALDNPLGLNDIASVSLNGNAENPGATHRSQSANLSYSIPFGYSTVSATFGKSRFAQIVQLTTTRVTSSGDSETAALRWDHLALRTASSKTGLYAELSTRRSHGFLDDVELTTQARRTTSLETGVNFKKLFASNASLDLSVGYRQGVAWLQAQDDLPSEAALTLRPHLWTLNAGAAVPFKQPALNGYGERSWQYSTSVRGQFTSNATTPIDQFAIGNRGSVRGFDGDAVLIAENGWAVRNELSTPLQFVGADASFYAGLDFGRVWGASDITLIGHDLIGAVIGWRAKWRATQFDLALATPLVVPDGFKTGHFNPYLSAALAF